MRKPKKAKLPKLVAIDLRKSDGHDHPDFDEDHYFLAKIGGQLYFGTFSKQWYGWSFDDGWGASGHQFDAPGSNRSQWQAVWKVENYKID